MKTWRPDGWLEGWTTQGCTNRNAAPLCDDHEVLARVNALQNARPPLACRCIAVDPTQHAQSRSNPDFARLATLVGSAR